MVDIQSSSNGRYKLAFYWRYACNNFSQQFISGAIDNHLHQGNLLKIDSRRIIFKRVMDMNDRALRNIVVGLG